MELEIKKDGVMTSIILNNPTGGQVKKGFKLLTRIVKEDKTEDLEALEKYLDYLDEMASELTGMKIEELDALESDEKNKIIKILDEKIKAKIGFLKSSSKQEDSSQQTNQTS